MNELDDILNELTDEVYVLVADLFSPDRIEVITPRMSLKQLYLYAGAHHSELASQPNLRHYYVAHYKKPSLGFYINSAANGTFTLLDTPVYEPLVARQMGISKGGIA